MHPDEFRKDANSIRALFHHCRNKKHRIPVICKTSYSQCWRVFSIWEPILGLIFPNRLCAKLIFNKPHCFSKKNSTKTRFTAWLSGSIRFGKLFTCTYLRLWNKTFGPQTWGYLTKVVNSDLTCDYGNQAYKTQTVGCIAYNTIVYEGKMLVYNTFVHERKKWEKKYVRKTYLQ